MTPIDDLFTEIAREHLGIETLETRNSDSLDFHNVSVWGVKDALQAAYEAGVRAMAAGPQPATAALHSPGHWHYEVSANCPSVWEITSEFCESPLAEVPRWPDEDGNDSPEAEANACLMTAAPRLYAACRMVVDRWERGDLAEAARACAAAIAATMASSAA